LIPVDKKLCSTPEGVYLQHTKGVGLFKQGKYREGLEIFQKSQVFLFLHLMDKIPDSQLT
jgi:hypothetical protein